MTLCLVDGDILLYRVGFAVQKNRHVLYVNKEPLLETFDKRELNKLIKESSFEDYFVESTTIVEPVTHAYHAMDTTMDYILRKTDPAEYEVVLSGEGNYRDSIATIAPYKGNRIDAAKPVYYDELYDYLAERYKATVVDGQEADDYIGITQCKEYPNSIIVSIDKDLDQIIGDHYNYVDDVFYTVTPEQADFYFFCQVLAGDPVDNIKGIPGIGMKKAEKLLEEGFGNYQKLVQLALDAYAQAGIAEHFLETARLVRIRRTENELWEYSYDL